jgi:hypothetical protein
MDEASLLSFISSLAFSGVRDGEMVCHVI